MVCQLPSEHWNGYYPWIDFKEVWLIINCKRQCFLVYIHYREKKLTGEYSVTTTHRGHWSKLHSSTAGGRTAPKSLQNWSSTAASLTPSIWRKQVMLLTRKPRLQVFEQAPCTESYSKVTAGLQWNKMTYTRLKLNNGNCYQWGIIYAYKLLVQNHIHRWSLGYNEVYWQGVGRWGGGGLSPLPNPHFSNIRLKTLSFKNDSLKINSLHAPIFSYKLFMTFESV